MRRIICLALLSLAVAAGVALAANSGTLVVEVVDAKGEPIAHVAVRLRSTVMVSVREVQSDETGQVRFAGLAPGRYELEAPEAPNAPTRSSPSARASVEVRLGEVIVARLRPGSPDVAETATVHGEDSPTDTRNARVASHLVLPALDSLPVTRDYRGYVQLVPGVNVVPNGVALEVSREPASKAGNNYQDRGAVPGSQDNTYYLDGLNITGMASGTGDLVFDNEIIREQEVITSGVPPELGGGAGYVTNVVTKSGGSQFSGSVNLFLQNHGMVERQRSDDSRLRQALQNRYDGGLTLGGPLARERLWFLLAAQQRDKSSSSRLSSSASPTAQTVDYGERRRSLFGKLTWAPSAADTLTGLYSADPFETRGTADVNVPPNRFSRSTSDPRTALLSYQRVAGQSWFFEGRFAHLEQDDVSRAENPNAGPANTILFPAGDPAPAYARLLGSAPGRSETDYTREQGDVNATAFLPWHGDHTVKIGAQVERWREAVQGSSGFGFTLTSLAPSLTGISFAEARDLNLLPESEYDFVYRSLLAAPSSAAFHAADRNGDGAVSPDEFAALTFRSNANNRGGVNFLRAEDLRVGVSDIEMRNRVAYGQETWHTGPFTLQAGMRTEIHSYIASDGSTILTMAPAWLPRLGITWAPGNDGQQRLSLTYAEYVNPLRTSMVRFAGNLTGSVSADEIHIGDDWFTYRVRGSLSRNRDAGFAPNLRNETEREWALTYAAVISPTLNVLAQAYDRRDHGMIEDYDPSVYFNPAVAGALVLTPQDFGYGPGGPTDVNYFLGNLVGGQRTTRGLDLALERRFQGNWSGSLQYSYKWSRGNTNSQGAADLQGDFLQLDPRQPWMSGPIPGTIPHQLKAFGVYRTPFRLEIGALAYWTSGARYTEADIFHPTSSDIYYNHRLPDGAYVRMGNKQQPSWSTLDLRLRYPIALGRGFLADCFLDVRNALNSQSAIRVESGYGDPTFQYGEPRELLLPRRWEVGVRVGW
ncbi:MAG: TonB-dependent receptor [Acidobacteriota bacterium]